MRRLPFRRSAQRLPRAHRFADLSRCSLASSPDRWLRMILLWEATGPLGAAQHKKRRTDPFVSDGPDSSLRPWLTAPRQRPSSIGASRWAVARLPRYFTTRDALIRPNRGRGENIPVIPSGSFPHVNALSALAAMRPRVHARNERTQSLLLNYRRATAVPHSAARSPAFTITPRDPCSRHPTGPPTETHASAAARSLL